MYYFFWDSFPFLLSSLIILLRMIVAATASMDMLELFLIRLAKALQILSLFYERSLEL